MEHFWPESVVTAARNNDSLCKWFDSGQLKGYRIPGSKDRRIPVDELVRFMKVHNMPTSALPVGRMRVLIADTNSMNAETLAEALQTHAEYDVQIVRTNFETGLIAQKFAPHVLLINLLADGIAATEICRNIRESEELQTIRIIALANNLGLSEAQALLKKGFDGFVSDAADVDDVIRKIEETTAIVY